MQIVDAQVHIWGTGLPSNRLHRQITSFSAAEAVAMMDEGGVDAAVINPPPWDPGGLELAQRAVRDYPGRFAIMETMPVDAPNGRDLIAGCRERMGVLGLRFLLWREPMRRLLDSGELDWAFEAAERADVPISIIAPDSLAVVGRIAERHPGLRLAFDHLGGRGGASDLRDDAAMTHIPELLALAKHPNIAVKATGAPVYSTEAYPYRGMHGYLRQIFDAFGPERMFWGTDITKMPCSWRQCVAMFTGELDWLTGRDLELVMGDALCTWWSWDRTL